LLSAWIASLPPDRPRPRTGSGTNPSARGGAAPRRRTRAPHTDLQRNIIQFCRLLRENELLVTPSEVIDAIRTADVVDLTDRQEFKLALRSVLTSRPEDGPVYDRAFEEFWRTRLEDLRQPGEQEEDAISSQNPEAQSEDKQVPQISQGEEPDENSEDELDVPMYSPVEVLAGRDFSSFDPDEMSDIARAIMVIARRLATRESRRYRPTRRGHRIDMRRTIRRNIKYGGTIVELAHKARKIRKPRIVLICDVSRSMDT
jgi:uncharacterized protein